MPPPLSSPVAGDAVLPQTHHQVHCALHTVHHSDGVPDIIIISTIIIIIIIMSMVAVRWQD